jgi:fluoroquinolone transport system ATP-binding protein
VCDRVASIVDGEVRLVGAPHALKLRHGRRAVRVEYRAEGRTEQRDFPLETLSDDPGFIGLLRGGGVPRSRTRNWKPL